MGEYYNWVNVDRKEYICPADFDLCNKLLDSSDPYNPFLCALGQLLKNEWKDSHILFLGDSKDLSKDDTNETLSILYRHSEESGFTGCGIDTIVETYKNISGWFSEAEKCVRKEIEFYLQDLKNGGLDLFNEYNVDPENPYSNLFSRKGCEYRYVVNQSKNVLYSPEEIVVDRVIDQRTKKDSANPLFKMISHPSKEKNCKIDPLPYLMRYGYAGTGDWVGDIIGVSDEIVYGYKRINKITIGY